MDRVYLAHVGHELCDVAPGPEHHVRGAHRLEETVLLHLVVQDAVLSRHCAPNTPINRQLTLHTAFANRGQTRQRGGTGGESGAGRSDIDRRGLWVVGLFTSGDGSLGVLESLAPYA